MTVPPHLAYGDHGVGDDIPGGATLTFDVRLVQLNNAVWSEEVRNKKNFTLEEETEEGSIHKFCLGPSCS